MKAFSALLAPCAGKSQITGDFPAQRPVMRSFDVFFHLRLNKQTSKQSRRRWFEALARSLWRHCNEDVYACVYVDVAMPLLRLAFSGYSLIYFIVSLDTFWTKSREAGIMRFINTFATLMVPVRTEFKTLMGNVRFRSLILQFPCHNLFWKNDQWFCFHTDYLFVKIAVKWPPLLIPFKLHLINIQHLSQSKICVWNIKCQLHIGL